MKQFRRADRVGEEMRRIICSLMENDLAGQYPGMITFTHVSVTTDLRYAKVYYSFMGPEENQRIIDEFFSREKRRIQHLVGKALQIRRIPELTFKYDSAVKEGMRIESLLNDINAEKNE